MRGKLMADIEQIYREYFYDIFRYLMSLCHDENTAEELAAETFFRAVLSFKSFRNESDIRVWLCSIARNLFFDRQKQLKRFTDLSDTGMMRIPDTNKTPEEDMLAGETYQQAVREVSLLKEPYKTVFYMRTVENSSFRDIANRLHKTENWACVTYHRARKMIREAMENE